MISNKLLIITGFILIAAACSTGVNNVQDITISYYGDNKADATLAEDLMYYDARYIAANVSGFDQQTAPGISLGYFVRESDGVPSYRIQYDLTNPRVAENISALKEGFELFIPKLAADHAGKAAVFTQLIPQGQAWVSTLFNGQHAQLLNQRSELIKTQMTADKLDELATRLSSDYGRDPELSFIRAQYYRAFENSPELISLHYLADAKDGKSILISISTHQQENKWSLLGLWFEAITSR